MESQSETSLPETDVPVKLWALEPSMCGGDKKFIYNDIYFSTSEQIWSQLWGLQTCKTICKGSIGNILMRITQSDEITQEVSF